MKKAPNGSNGNSLKSYRKELLKKKAELMVSLGTNFKRLADADRSSEDDLIAVTHDEFIHVGVSRVLYAQLRQVEAALGRLDLKEYGICGRCGASISPKRLEAVPWARYCVDCQDSTDTGKAEEVITWRGSLDHAAASESSPLE